MAHAAGLALLVFGATYVLLSLGRVRKFRIDRAAAALFGGIVMLLVVLAAGDAGPGAVTAIQSAVNLDVLLLLLGMLLLVAGLDAAGFFEWTAVRLSRRVVDARQLLVVTAAATALLSAVALNDAVVLLFTPAVIRTCRLLKANPVPFVVTIALAANIGSVATPMGNPQNAFIAVHAGIPFTAFAGALALIAALSLLVAIVLVLALLHRRFRPGGDLAGTFRPELRDAKFTADETGKPRDPRLLRLSLIVLAATMAGFVLSSFLGLPISLVALSGGATVLFLGPLLSRTEPSEVLRRVDWSILLLFLGLFLVIGGLQATGDAAAIHTALAKVTPGGLGDIGGLHVASSLLSNLVSNVPAVLLLAGPLDALGSVRHWLALASSSTLAGNATLLGAAANVIAVEVARREGVEVRFRDFLYLGLPVALVTVAVSAALLSLR